MFRRFLTKSSITAGAFALPFALLIAGCGEPAADSAGSGTAGSTKSEPAPASAAVSAAWMENYEDAIAEAKKTGKPILADFTGSDWCGWCIRLKKEVFDTPEFVEWSQENVILLELDFPRRKELAPEIAAQNKMLSAKFSIRGYPTILFLNDDGESIGQSGYRKGGPAAWIKHAEGLLAK